MKSRKSKWVVLVQQLFEKRQQKAVDIVYITNCMYKFKSRKMKITYVPYGAEILNRGVNFSLVSISVIEIGRVVVSNAFLSQQWGIWRDNPTHRHSNWRVELRYVMKLKAYLWLPVRFSVQKLLRNQKWIILVRNYKVTLTMFSQAFKLKMIIRFLIFFMTAISETEFTNFSDGI